MADTTNTNFETYKNYILPLAGLVEILATKGKSPARFALGQQQYISGLEENKARQEQARQQAIMNQLAGKKTQLELDALEQKKANDEAYQRELEKLSGIEEDKKEAALTDLMLRYYPKEYLSSMRELNRFERGEMSKTREQERKGKETATKTEYEQKGYNGEDIGMPLEELLKSDPVAYASYLTGVAKKKDEERRFQQQKEIALISKQESNALPTQQEKGNLGAIAGTVDALNILIDDFKNKNLGTVSKGLQGAVSGVPIVGQRLAPEVAQFNAMKGPIVERFLRAATGAAAPISEQKQYIEMLPSPGDTPELADSKIKGFLSNMKMKADEYASRLEASGDIAGAEKQRKMIDDMISKVKVFGVTNTQNTGSGPWKNYQK
jgi:hypothetical protein